MNLRPLSMETQLKIGAILLFTGQIEQELELIRQKLCKNKLFDPYSAFTRVDRSSKGYVTAKDLIAFLK